MVEKSEWNIPFRSQDNLLETCSIYIDKFFVNVDIIIVNVNVIS